MRIEIDPAPRLNAARATAAGLVAKWAARERSRHITNIPGQDMIYMAKEAEALRYLAEPSEPVDLAEYPLIAAEVGITAETAHQMAMAWANMGGLWRSVAAHIEGARLGALKAIAEAKDESTIWAAVAFTEKT